MGELRGEVLLERRPVRSKRSVGSQDEGKVAIKDDDDNEAIDNPKWGRIKGRYQQREVSGNRMPNKVAIREQEDDDENEPIDNPKWGRIKDRYQRVVGRDGGSRGERFRRERFDKPDVRQWNKQENWGRKQGNHRCQRWWGKEFMVLGRSLQHSRLGGGSFMHCIDRKVWI